MTHAAHVGGRKNRLDVISSDGVRFIWTCIIIRRELLGIAPTKAEWLRGVALTNASYEDTEESGRESV